MTNVLPLPRWVLISGLVILFVPFASFLVNHSAVHRFILQHLQNQTGIEVGALHVDLFPTLSIHVFDLLVRDDLRSEPALRAPHASLSIRLWPLVTKQVALLELQIVQPEVVIRRDRNGIWHVPLIDNQKTAPRAGDTPDRPWSINGFRLRDGNLLILDEDRLPGGIKIHSVEAAFEPNQAQTQAEVLLSGSAGDGGDLRVTGSVTLAKKDRSYAVSPVQFEGSFRVDRFDLAYWFERTGRAVFSESNKAAWRGNIAADIHVDLLPREGFNVTVSGLKTDLNWLVIRGRGAVQGVGTNHSDYALTLSTSPFRLEHLFELIPPSWIPVKVRAAVEEHDIKGVIEFVSVALDGPMNVLQVPEQWHVAANFTNGSGVWDKQGPPVQNLTATLSWGPKRADVTNFAVDVNRVHITTSKLTVSDLDLGPTLDAHLLGVGTLEHVLAVVHRFGGGNGGIPVLQNITDPTGTLQWAVHLTGPIFPQASLRIMNAELRVQDLGGRMGSTFAIGHVNGSFASDSRFLSVKHVQGLIQGIRFETEGAVDLESGGRIRDLKVHMSADGRAMQNLLAAFVLISPRMLIEGPTRATLDISGTADAAHCRSTIDITGTEIIVPHLVHKRKGIPGRLDFEANVLDGKRVLVDHLTLAVSDSALQAAAQVELGRLPKFRVQMKAGPLSFRALAELGIRTPITEGIFEISATVSGEGSNWKAWAPSGWVSLRGGVVALPALEKELTEVSGRLQFTPRAALIDAFSLKFGESDVKLTGMIEHWRSDPRATFLVESSQFDVANVLVKRAGNHSTMNGNLREWMQSKEATISFLVGQLQYERLVLRTVSGELKVDERRATINEVRSETPNGVLSGHVEARLGSRDRMDIDAELSVDGIPAQEILSTRSGETEPLQGNVSLNGVIKAKVDAGTPIQHTLSTAHPGLTVKVTNGRLRQDPVLTKVIKILNLPAVLSGQVDLSQGGIPFDSLSARIVARNGLLSSEDILFDSPIIKVTGAGTADIKENALDLALAVSPMAAYSNLIGKIPMFGPLFGGDYPGLSTALFEAKGSLQDPQVAYLPLESLGKGLTGYPRLAIGVLVHTLNLPYNAVTYAAR